MGSEITFVKTRAHTQLSWSPRHVLFLIWPQVTPGDNKAKTQEATNVSPACASSHVQHQVLQEVAETTRSAGAERTSRPWEGQPQWPLGEDRSPSPVTGLPGSSGLPQGSVLSPEAEGRRSKAEAPGSCPDPCWRGRGASAPPKWGWIRDRGQRPHGTLPAPAHF